jgi:hypothetical protein
MRIPFQYSVLATAVILVGCGGGGGGLAQCCEILIDNSVCFVYNRVNTSGIRRIACQIG